MDDALAGNQANLANLRDQEQSRLRTLKYSRVISDLECTPQFRDDLMDFIGADTLNLMSHVQTNQEMQ